MMMFTEQQQEKHSKKNKKKPIRSFWCRRRRLVEAYEIKSEFEGAV